MNNFIFTPTTDPLLNPEVIDRQLEQLKMLKTKVMANNITDIPKNLRMIFGLKLKTN